MEGWRRTAAAVSVQNLTNINITMDAFQAIDVAHRHFAELAEFYRRFGLGLPYQPADGGAHPDIRTATGRVRSAILSTMRLSSYHAGSGHVFSVGAASIGLQGSAPWWWQRWEVHHAESAAHADMALQRLRSTWVHGVAADYLDHHIRYSPLQDLYVWGPAAEQLLRRATDELAMARAALERMRPAVVAEFSDAWMLLSR